MLSIEEILKMSEDMGIEIVDGTSGKHYILDDSGKEIEFNTEMVTSNGLLIWVERALLFRLLEVE